MNPDADTLEYTVDDEGIVRIPSIERGCAVLIGKETLEELLTDVYSQAFADIEVERSKRK